MDEPGELQKVLDGITLDIRMGRPIQLELKPLVDKYFPDDYKKAVKWGAITTRGIINGAMVPNRNIPFADIRITPGRQYENDAGWTPEARDSGRYPQIGIGGMPNVYRGPLDEEAPSHVPPAKYLGT